MFNQNDFFFDNKIRLAIERHTDMRLIPDWSKLEQKLDIEMPVKKERRRFFVFWLLLAGLIAGTVYRRVDVNPGSNQNYVRKPPIVIKPNVILPTENRNNENVKMQNEKAFTDSTDIVLNHLKPVFLNKKEENTIPFHRPPKEQVNVVPENIKEDVKENSEKIFSLSAINIKNKSNPLNMTSGDRENDTVTNDDLWKSGSVKDIANDTSNGIESKSKVIQKKISSSRFSFTAVSGVNVNSVQLNKPSKPGYDYGFMVGYKISPKFEIRSGIIFSKKYFNASGKEISFDSVKLNLPSYTTIKLEDAAGYCRFLETPIMVYYNFPVQKKTSFYTAAGFSITTMRMESVHYKFVADGNTIIERSHSNAWHSSSDFSTSITSNFSVGIKQYITKSWSVSLEPYVRLPLTRFNDNNLKFTSLGTMFSLTYSLPEQRIK